MSRNPAAARRFTSTEREPPGGRHRRPPGGVSAKAELARCDDTPRVASIRHTGGAVRIDANSTVLCRRPPQEGPAGRAPDGAGGAPDREGRCSEGEGDRLPEHATAVESRDVEASAVCR